MNKFLTVFLFILFSPSALSEIRLELPDSWSREGSIIYSNGEKVGELVSAKSRNYADGHEFIQAYKAGFFDDPGSTKFLLSGITDGIHWVCRVADYEGAQGELGTWYIRSFWVNGPIVIMYSMESCESGFLSVLEIAKSAIETNT